MEEQKYKWYPKHANGEPNLNPWWAIGYRRANQWLRRFVYWRFRPQRYNELIAEQAITAHPDIITEEDRQRLGELMWILGDDMPYRYTEEQGKRMNQEMSEIVGEILVKARMGKTNE